MSKSKNNPIAAHVALLVAVAALSGCDAPKTPTTYNPPPPSPEVSVYDISGNRSEHSMTATGIVANRSGRTLQRLVVRVSVLDASGNKIDDAADSVLDLDAGKTWKFEATSFRSGAARYQVEGVWANGRELYAEYLDEKRREQKQTEDREAAERDAQSIAIYHEQLRINAEQAKQARAVKDFELHALRATNGVSASQFQLGRYYLTGHGTETNLALARHWLHAAGYSGNEPEALKLLSKLPYLQ